ncbi:MAG: pterin-4-alpha-carbinolamine dehydratase [Acidobacteriales bacterium]|nr:pterin-4-alpha-carbinolamine dehydratase [Terriglobales bacterium]
MPSIVLTDQEVDSALKELPGWKRSGRAIERRYEFPDFAKAMEFVNNVAEAAEKADHHPDIDIRYNKVLMALTSHDSGGVTNRDLKMAKRINEFG